MHRPSFLPREEKRGRKDLSSYIPKKKEHRKKRGDFFLPWLQERKGRGAFH